MNIEFFHEFVVVARRLNYRAAAAELCMSESALSKHIKAIEVEYGAQLFKRDRRGVALTPEGGVLLESAQRIWREYELSRTAVAQSASRRPLIVSGMVEAPTEHEVVVQVVSYMASHGATKKLHVRNAGSLSASKQLDALAKGNLDCFVSYNLSPTANEGIGVAPLCDIPLHAIVSAESALATRSALAVSDLAGATFVHLSGPNFTPTWNIIEHMLNRKGVPHLVRAVPTDSVYDYMDIALGSSVLVVPLRRNANIEAHPNMRFLDISDGDFVLHLGAAFRTADQDDASLACLIAGLKASYQNAYR